MILPVAALLLWTTASPWRELDRAWKSERGMRIEDAYKWLYHATLGGEHAAGSLEGVRGWMTREWATLGPARENEPLTVTLLPSKDLIRVNLRPYRERGGDPEFLTAIFFFSAEQFHADKSDFVDLWCRFGARLKRREGRFSYSGWQRLDRRTRKDGYPAIEHSSAYLKAMHPAYRVVRRDLWDTAGLEQILGISPKPLR